MVATAPPILEFGPSSSATMKHQNKCDLQPVSLIKLTLPISGHASRIYSTRSPMYGIFNFIAHLNKYNYLLYSSEIICYSINIVHVSNQCYFHISISIPDSFIHRTKTYWGLRWPFLYTNLTFPHRSTLKFLH